ncbi:MAG: hypothetical protein RSC06_11615, partial [Clostridia bacterium]
MVASGKRKKRALIALAVVLALVLALALYAVGNLSKLMISMAEARARQLAVEAINQAVAEVMNQSVGYQDLVQASVDKSGQVTMLKA